MQLKCPQCDYEGEFKKGKTPFFIFSLLDAYMAGKRAQRTFVCPECGTEITLKKSNVPVKSVSLPVIGVIVAVTLLIVIFSMNESWKKQAFDFLINLMNN